MVETLIGAVKVPLGVTVNGGLTSAACRGIGVAVLGSSLILVSIANATADSAGPRVQDTVALTVLVGLMLAVLGAVIAEAKAWRS